jgi:hypothetical protein
MFNGYAADEFLVATGAQSTCCSHAQITRAQSAISLDDPSTRAASGFLILD